MEQPTREALLMRPTSIRDTGLSMDVLTGIALKAIYNAGEITGNDLVKELCLPFAGVVQRVLEQLDRTELVTVVGAGGFGEQAFRYAVSRKGAEQVRQVMERNQYSGPAPVPLKAYNAMVRAQAVGDVVLNQEEIAQAFDGMVIDAAMFDKIGPALLSGESIFLYGPPGNGKTSIATRMARLLAHDPIYIPYAVAVDQHVIKLFDEYNHRRVEETAPRPETTNIWADDTTAALDERWVLVERPNIVVGGELNLESLDLIWDPAVKYYEAPLQMKANGGMFLIDDFGRQQMDPQDLLNRWIVPLETHVDFLKLHTGRKIEIPFEQLVVFSTNLDPKDLVDEAFLRRIRHKLKVGDPTKSEFQQIFQIMCRARSVEYSDEGFVHLMSEWYERPGRSLRSCHPRDILAQVQDLAKYRGVAPQVTRATIDRACAAYFAEL